MVEKVSWGNFKFARVNSIDYLQFESEEPYVLDMKNSSDSDNDAASKMSHASDCIRAKVKQTFQTTSSHLLLCDTMQVIYLTSWIV